MDVYRTERMIYHKEDIKKINSIVSLFNKLGGIPYSILYESGLLKLSEDGLLNENQWDEKSLIGQYKLNKVDMYAIDTCLSVVKKEQFIRENIDPNFSVERIDYNLFIRGENPFDSVDEMDPAVELLRLGESDIFLYEKGVEIDNCSLAYKHLVFQTAYIKYYYPEVKTFLEKSSTNGDVIEDVDAIAVALGEEACYGAVCHKDNKVEMITKTEADFFVLPDELEYKFGGFGNIWSPGLASSEMAFQLSEIKDLTEKKYHHKVNSAVIVLPAFLPEEEEMRNLGDELERTAYKNKNKRIDWEVYEALDLYGRSGYEVVKRATELLPLEHVEIVPRAVAIAEAYGYMNEDNKLSDFQYGLVFDWEKDYFLASVVCGKKNEKCYILHQKVINSPIDERFMNNLEDTMHDEMCKSGILQGDNEYSRERGWDKFYDQKEKIIKQVIRNNYGILRYEDHIISMDEFYSAQCFEEIFEPYYVKVENIIVNMLQEINFQKVDISRVFLSGMWGNYPFVKKKLESFLEEYKKVCTMADTTLAPIKGAAYLSKSILD